MNLFLNQLLFRQTLLFSLPSDDSVEALIAFWNREMAQGIDTVTPSALSPWIQLNSLPGSLGNWWQ